ncbi:polar amino acid ABC transporter ATP-binding protein [Spirochaetia bacterium]|nr:polar amino acid ABC transporter ATP-binding protein [Spirochaetia bacterium]
MIVSLEKISKSFGTNQVLREVNLGVEKGEIVSIIGQSGAGKTTLLRMINWLEKPDSGEITVDGEKVTASPLYRLGAKKADIQRLRSKSSMVFQHYNLFKNKTALQNVTESLITVKKINRLEADEKGLELLRSVGLENKAGEYPSRLSGGQQQRIGIARALAVDPRVMLFDEPTSALDPEWIAEVLEVIKRIAAGGMTMILVSHELRFVKDVASRVVFLDGGTIIEDGKPEQIFNRPVHERTRAFLLKSRDYDLVW